MTNEDIHRQLKALDAEFDSPENKKSGALDLAKWSARRAAIVQRHAARAESTAPAPIAALTKADVDSLFRPPRFDDLSRADRTELDAFTRGFDAALRDGDLQSARTIQQNPRRESLSHTAQISYIAQSLKKSYDQNGAKIFAALMTGAIAALYQELHETRLAMRLQRAHSERLERMLSQRSGPDGFDAALDGRMLRLSFQVGDRVISKDVRLPIPIDRGVYRSGMKAEQGDVVTFGGSQWIALKDTKDKPPSDSWRLCVARGRDGTGSR